MSVHAPQKRLTFGLTLRYTLVLALLAALVTANFFLLHRQMELDSADSAVLNASGRQRMLSQRAALFAGQLAAAEDGDAIRRLSAELRQMHAVLNVTHQRLVGVVTASEDGSELDARMQAFYREGPDALERLFHDYAAFLQRLVETPAADRAQQRVLADRITAIAVDGRLLEKLDGAVHLFQQRSEAHLQRIKRQQGWIWLGVLVTVAYSAFGVFRPMVRRIQTELIELNDIKRTLIMRVRERTLEVQRLAQAVEASAEAVVITDIHGVIQFVNPAALRLNGYDEAELIGRDARLFRADKPDDDHYAAMWATISGGAVWIGDVLNRRKDGSHYHAHLTIAPIRRDDGSIDGYVAIQSDITALKQAEERLQSANQALDRLATEDALTGIANRRVFDRDLDEEWGRARRSGQALAMIMIDIDFFKAYNDTFGHQQGDVCLQQVAQCLRQSLSRPGDRVARYGGEEFAVLLPDTNIPGALDVAETIRRNIGQLALPAANTSVSAHVSVSMGVASMVPGRKQSQADLVQAADRALYQAKHAGRDRAVSV